MSTFALPDIPGLDAEQRMLVGSILRDPQSITQASALRAAHFCTPECWTIFSNIITRVVTGYSTNLSEIEQDLERSDALKDIGGSTFLDHLLALPPVDDVALAAARIHDAWQRQQIAALLRQSLLDLNEHLLDALAFTSRQTAQQIAIRSANRVATTYAVLQAIMEPAPPMLAGPIDNTVKVLVTFDSEIADLANMHDRLAEEERQQGNFFSCGRNSRAEQLRAMLGEAAP